MPKDLRQFLQTAKEAGPEYYVEVKKPLNPELEVDVLQLKLDREGRYPVIYCPEIEGSRLPLVTNLFGSHEMLALALGMEPKTTGKAEIFKEYRYDPNLIIERLWRYAYLNKGLRLHFEDQVIFSENGLKDLLEKEVGVMFLG